ncbi:unnamed protein product [Rotaria sordida]|uniref:Cytochrome b561 domain-containing protein n=1 Tax=Rotaria sordida TaxID=392033 RepID=A0A815L3D6_9BILA|nr:unnamed protein product [Rotaria sordida]CAF4065126.1 unnamed protein product [Rotaria sordida]
MFVIVGRDPDRSYSILLCLGEIFGLLSIILVGLLFDRRVSSDVYNWKTNPFSYHPLMMTIGLLFCYGNAILLYRTFKQIPKLMVKIFHACFLIISLTLGTFGLAAIIRSKIITNRPHFMTFHSWIGIATIGLFVFQWICGFISYLFPKLSLDIRKGYMPTHRLWGKIIFLSSVASILTGLSEHGMTSSFFTMNDIQQSRRLVIIFFGIFTSLFSFIVIYLLSNSDYQRPPDQTDEKSVPNP